jgi:hypothetical protein
MLLKYVVVFPDNSEHFLEIDSMAKKTIEEICRDAVRSKNLTTSRKDPQEVVVKLFALSIRDGKLERRNCGNCKVMPYLEQMTSEEFTEFVFSFSWDSGHSSGYEEVVGIASSLASDLLPCIKKFQKRITNG